MIELHTWGTPNGRKVSVMLEECGLAYNVHRVDIGKGDQFKPEFLALNPNGKIPAILDPDGPGGRPISMFESGAILIYLAEKTGKLLPAAPRDKYAVLQWLMFQMGGVGPMFGQVHHFIRSAKEQVPYGIERYTTEKDRLYRVLDQRLGEARYLAGEYSIADIATFPWVARHEWHHTDLNDFANVKRWFDAIQARPAVQRGMAVPELMAMRDPQAPPGLEVLQAHARRITYPHPLLFVHGGYMGAWCWAEHFLPYFAARGFACYAVSLRGHGNSSSGGRLDVHTIGDYVDDVAAALSAIGRPAVVVGHSMGAFIAQKLLERRSLPATVLLAPVPPQGLAAATLSLALTDPVLLREVSALVSTGRTSPEGLRHAMFANPIDAEQLALYHSRCQRESHCAIWDMTWFNPVQAWRLGPAPLLYLAAELDRLMPLAHQRLGAALLGRSLEIAAGIGHGVMLESAWRGVADRVIAWLRGLE